MFIRLYYLDCWIQIIQSDEQNKSSTKCIIVQITQFDELLFVLFDLFGLANFPKTQLLTLPDVDIQASVVAFGDIVVVAVVVVVVVSTAAL